MLSSVLEIGNLFDGLLLIFSLIVRLIKICRAELEIANRRSRLLPWRRTFGERYWILKERFSGVLGTLIN
jgi:hypothetical protein